eukprot:gnl/TRDRNA2_/TRDRNA2_170319_c0_seq6.p1 gnl/TRDRNA2_/TRDRNA2_170319_c0~~gnl/TRDRNA2_/TRDRNA2_170319_c0_seq6.p1  ORF type:complete len:132 (-),score=16.92 gnl/TRDRNA2_/TRDRNA2_170319_c0_seq6:271-666(-)
MCRCVTLDANVAKNFLSSRAGQLAKAHAMFAKSCGLKSLIYYSATAAKGAMRGSISARIAEDAFATHAMIARLYTQNSATRSSAALVSTAPQPGSATVVAKAHAKLARSCMFNRRTHLAALANKANSFPSE